MLLIVEMKAFLPIWHRNFIEGRKKAERTDHNSWKGRKDSWRVAYCFGNINIAQGTDISRDFNIIFKERKS